MPVTSLHRVLSPVLLALALAGGTASAAGPSDAADAKQYHECLALARKQPEQGWEEALAWQGLGGGEPARHCAAIALIGLKKYEEAASRLEALAADSHRDAIVRAEMLAQAGQAWLMARQPERANAAQTSAIKLAPDQPDLLIDRAITLGDAKNWREAKADLDAALRLAPQRAEALALRGAAERYLDDLPAARTDVAAALGLDPQLPDAWLEKGVLARIDGDDGTARQAWRQVLALAPDTAAGDIARRNLEMLDLGGKRGGK